MRITATENPEIDIRYDSSPRSSGTHLSQILKHIAVKIGVFRDDDDAEEKVSWFGVNGFTLAAIMRIALGLAWEDWLSKQLAELLPGFMYHFGEVERDGIIGTPDGFDTDTMTVHEFKVTWRGSRKGVEGCWYWLAQVKAYCHMLGVCKAVLWVYYVNGDYTWSGPRFVRYDLEFTKEELEGNWRMILGDKNAVEPEEYEAA